MRDYSQVLLFCRCIMSVKLSYQRSSPRRTSTRAKMNNLINVVNILLQCCAAPWQQCCAAICQQLLSTTIVQSLLTAINRFVLSTIVSSCSNNIVTIIVICQHEQLLIEQYSWTLLIQQVLLNLINNIVQKLFSEQRCINLMNFCACT